MKTFRNACSRFDCFNTSGLLYFCLKLKGTITFICRFAINFIRTQEDSNDYNMDAKIHIHFARIRICKLTSRKYRRKTKKLSEVD